MTPLSKLTKIWTLAQWDDLLSTEYFDLYDGCVCPIREHSIIEIRGLKINPAVSKTHYLQIYNLEEVGYPFIDLVLYCEIDYLPNLMYILQEKGNPVSGAVIKWRLENGI
jgi:hypothetical protein